MDAYGDVKSSVGTHSETLLEQAWETFTRWKARRAGLRLSVKEVLYALEDKHLPADTKITPTSFCDLVTGLGKEQAAEVLIGALQDADDLERTADSVSGVIKMVGAVDTRVKAMNRNLTLLIGHSVASTTGTVKGPATSENILGAVVALTDSFRDHQEDTEKRLLRMEEYIRKVSAEVQDRNSGGSVGQRDPTNSRSKTGRSGLGGSALDGEDLRASKFKSAPGPVPLCFPSQW
mmetsp:Transcript_58586/g.125951  ORF Transcript_58586/g.125951 Transcript_58586/m.125951 type:complete len:234 (+) Transcript_58586:3-704(+)